MLGESLSSARSRLGTSTALAVIVAAVCASILVTAGRTAAAEADVLRRIDAAGSRALVVTDISASGGRLSPNSIETLSSLSSVEWVVGVSSPIDSRRVALVPGGAPVPSWKVAGEPFWLSMPPVGLSRSTRGLVGAQAQASLGLVAPFGAVRTSQGTSISLVGRFHAVDPLADLDSGLILPVPPSGLGDLRRLVVVATTPQAAAEVERLTMLIIGDVAPQDLRIESPRAVAELRAAVSGDLGGAGRSVTLGVLGAGLLVIGVVVLGETLTRRRDIGRARALGASRGILLGLLVLRTTVCAVPGALAGIALGLGILGRADSPGPLFIVAAAILSVLTAALAVLPPGLRAVRRDPVSVLRTP